MGVVMERWCPTQQMLGVFLRRIDVKKKLFVVAAAMLVTISAADASVACRLGGRWYAGRCPDRVAALGADGRTHWYRNPVYCQRSGVFLHWGHCTGREVRGY
jgi:hypothetical protein